MGLPNMWDGLPDGERGLYEQLAGIEHTRWADWQRYVHTTCGLRCADGSIVLPAGNVARWDRQIATPYAGLTEEERDSDRIQVARYWPLIVDFRDGHA